MDTTTNPPSMGDVLSANADEDLDAHDAPAPLSFEQKTIRALIALERRRLRIEQARFDLERLAVEQAHARRVAVFEATGPLLSAAKELLPSAFGLALPPAPATRLDAAVAELAAEFPDLRATLEGRLRAHREAALERGRATRC